MKVLALYSSLSLLLGGFSARHPLTQPQNARRNGISAPDSAGSSPVQATMKNVDFHLTDRIIVHIATLNGKLTPNQSAMPVFDNNQSFSLDVDTANITVSTTALSNDLNDFVFAKPDAPLKKLTVKEQKDFKVDANKVTSLLLGLSHLRAEKFVPSGKELKLDEDAFQIEITLSDKKVLELTVGGMEGPTESFGHSIVEWRPQRHAHFPARVRRQSDAGVPKR